MSDTRPAVLVIEDDDNIRELLVFMLEREEVEIVTAADGLDAKEKIETADTPPSLVLLDVMLPYEDGFQLLARIKRQPGWENVPVLMLTAKSTEQETVRALESGAEDYIVKPFQPMVLLARIKRYLEH